MRFLGAIDEFNTYPLQTAFITQKETGLHTCRSCRLCARVSHHATDSILWHGGIGLEIKDKEGREILLSEDGGRPSQLCFNGDVEDSAPRTSEDDEFIVFVSSSGMVVYRVNQDAVTLIMRHDVELVAPMRYQLIADEATGAFPQCHTKRD